MSSPVPSEHLLQDMLETRARNEIIGRRNKRTLVIQTVHQLLVDLRCPECGRRVTVMHGFLYGVLQQVITCPKCGVIPAEPKRLEVPAHE
jgi:ribosomal protein S27E